MRRFLFVVAAAALTLAGYTGAVGAEAAGATCHASASGLPDPKCTPGATNPSVTQQNIQSTICKAGWTTTVRPDPRYTERLKKQQMPVYGDGGSPGTYEEDHLIPLELGGAPKDGANLWPEPGGLPSPNNKDRVEDAAKDAVCSGRMPLAAAQRAIASNWIQLGQQLGAVPTPTASPTPTPSPTTTPTPPPPAAVPAPPAQAAPAPATPAPAPTAAPAQAPAASGCYPHTNSGGCYSAGEICRSADHGATGRAENGEAIVCRNNNGWRWEPA